MLAIPLRAGAALLPLLLAACAGGSPDTSALPIGTGEPPALYSATTDSRKTATAGADTAYTTNEALILFDWAQYSFPDFFVDSQTIYPLDYLGTSYLVRSYPNGNNLGLTLDGRIFGLGPFTGNVLQGFGKYTDYVQAVERDRCGFRPQWCLPAKVATAPASLSVPAIQPVSFSVTASGTAPFTYQWLRNGVEVLGATGATVSIAKATYPEDQARYSVRVANAYGSATSTEATLTVTSPLIGRTWAGGQALEENTSALSVIERRAAIDDAGNVTALFRKSNGTRNVLYATRGTPGAKGSAPTWSPPIAIDLLGTGFAGVSGNYTSSVGNFNVITAPSGDAYAYWLAWEKCTTATYNPDPAQGCWYLYVATFKSATGWTAPTPVTDLAPPGWLGGMELSAIGAAVNDRGDIVFQGPGWVRSGAASFTAARAFYFRTGAETQFRRQLFETPAFGNFNWCLDSAGNLLLGANLTQNATTDIVAYKGTVSAQFDFSTPQILDTRGAAASLVAVAGGQNGQAAILWVQNNGATDKMFAATRSSVTAPFVVGESTAPATGRYLMSTMSDEGQLFLYYVNGGSRVTWTSQSGWSPVQSMPSGFPGQNADFGFDTGYYYTLARSGDMLGVNVDNGAVLTYDARGNSFVMRVPAVSNNLPPYVLGYSAGNLGLGRSPLLAFNGTGFVSMLNRYDALPTPTAPNGDGRSVANLWGAFLKY